LKLSTSARLHQTVFCIERINHHLVATSLPNLYTSPFPIFFNSLIVLSVLGRSITVFLVTFFSEASLSSKKILSSVRSLIVYLTRLNQRHGISEIFSFRKITLPTSSGAARSHLNVANPVVKLCLSSSLTHVLLSCSSVGTCSCSFVFSSVLVLSDVGVVVEGLALVPCSLD